MCHIQDFERLGLERIHPFYHVTLRKIIEAELPLYHQAYPVGKHVVDLGAGCGETAQYYLNHGAEQVISIEGDPNCFRILQENFRDDPRVIPVLCNVDHIKVDIEGGEKNMIVETHFPCYLERLHAFPSYDADTSLWRLVEMESVHRMMKRADNLRRRLHYFRIQTAHYLKEFVKL